jgi:hypothetical protein
VSAEKEHQRFESAIATRDNTEQFSSFAVKVGRGRVAMAMVTKAVLTVLRENMWKVRVMNGEKGRKNS